MALRILLAFDKFKGSLTSSEAAEAFALGLRDVVPSVEVDIAEVSDGGDGLVTTLSRAMGGELCRTRVHDPLNRPHEALWATIDGGATAVIEMSEAAGLRLLEESEYNPLRTSTYGVGELMLGALDRGCRRMILGLGGSATNDGGMGMLQALGVRFFDAEGRLLAASGEAMCRVATIDISGLDARLEGVDIVVASDVDNPLYGERGAAYVYAPQKGATNHDVELLDAGLRRYHEAVRSAVGEDYATVPGAGAAGGVGYALIATLGATLRQGVELVMEMTRFAERASRCDIIVTGEGRLDRQTLMGKAPSGVLDVGRRLGVDVIAIGGSVSDAEALVEGGFWRVYAATPEGMALREAMKRDTAQQNLRHAAHVVAREILAHGAL
jgi:glycerate kinase